MRPLCYCCETDWPARPVRSGPGGLGFAADPRRARCFVRPCSALAPTCLSLSRHLRARRSEGLLPEGIVQVLEEVDGLHALQVRDGVAEGGLDPHLEG